MRTGSRRFKGWQQDNEIPARHFTTVRLAMAYAEGVTDGVALSGKNKR
jgi:hypothetical protein